MHLRAVFEVVADGGEDGGGTRPEALQQAAELFTQPSITLHTQLILLAPPGREPPMRPKQPEAEPQEDLFRARLDNLVDPRHALVRLAALIDWVGSRPPSARSTRTAAAPAADAPHGRPAPAEAHGRALRRGGLRPLPRQPLCAAVLRRDLLPARPAARPLLDDPLAPAHRAERLEVLLAESLAAAQRGGAVEEKHLRRVTIDTTVQPKAVTHPTDSKLLQRGIEILARLARRHGVRLRQSYLRVARHARREAARLIHSGRPRQAERHVRRLRTLLGRLSRDIARKIARAPQPVRLRHRSAIARCCATPQDRPRQALRIARPRGGVHRQGQGAGALRVRREGLARDHQRGRARRAVRARRAPLPGNPYDGHTLAPRSPRPSASPASSRARLRRPRLSRPRRRPRPVFLSRQSAAHADHPRERRRRNAIEPVIGHMKSDGHLAAISCRHRATPSTSSSPPPATTSASSAPGSHASLRSSSASSPHALDRRPTAPPLPPHLASTVIVKR